MSALTDLFTSFANKIRSKVGGSQTYTPLQMVDAIDDVYDAGAASVPTPTSITPSNSSPVALTANTPVNPTASGYAIESYSIITPSTAPSTPTLNAGSIYKPDTSGYAINTYSMILPLDGGVAFDSGFIKMYASGYAYRNRPCGRVLFGATLTASRTTSWEPYEFTTESYESDGASSAVALDNHFCHINANGDLVVDRAISTAYLAGGAMRGETSSGTAVYSGIAIYKNGSLVHSVYGNSTTTSPVFRRIQTSFAVGDVIQIQTRCSTTTQGYAKTYLNITWEGT